VFGLPLAFAAPAVLVALVALGALYYFLRVTPPRPRQVVFPPLRLLLGLCRLRVGHIRSHEHRKRAGAANHQQR